MARGVEAAPGRLERDWWLRTLLVLQSPRAVFAALRDERDEAVQARQEPLVAVVFLAGIAGVLSTTLAGRLLDDPEYDALVVVLWAIVGGGIYGLVGYFIVGALAYLGLQLFGSTVSHRLARQAVGFSAVPLALSLAAWPVRLAVYGEDTFTTGGSDTGLGNDLFEALELGALAWAVVLLAIGLRVVSGLSWPRTLAAALVPAGVPALALARAAGLI